MPSSIKLTEAETMALAEYLRAGQRLKRYSSEEIAHRLGYSPIQIKGVLGGRLTPSLGLLLALCRLLDVQIILPDDLGKSRVQGKNVQPWHRR